MIPFKKYLGETESPDWINSDATVLSFTSLEKLLFERPNLEYCILVPHKLNDRRVHQELRAYFQEQRCSMYPVATRNRKQHGRTYVITKKPHTRSQDFREMVSDGYYALDTFGAIYTNGTTIKVLDKSNISEIQEEASISKFQEIASNILGKKTTFLGVEVALNEDTKYHFRNNNLISYPITNYDRQYAKNWNDFLND